MPVVLLTGPSRGLGRAAALAMARMRPSPRLLLLGRASPALRGVTEEVAARGALVETIVTDLADLTAVRAAAGSIQEALGGQFLNAIILNAAIQRTDRAGVSVDGFELTFAVNHLSSVLLLAMLDDQLADGARVLLVGSGTHRGGRFQNALSVPDPRWEETRVLAQPVPDSKASDGRRAYATSKLATMYLSHELQRRRPDLAVNVFDPGLMPGTDLVRDAGLGVRLAWRSVMKGMRVLPGVSSARRSGDALAALALGRKSARLRGAYIEIDKETKPAPHAFDELREEELWRESRLLVGLND
ncbi:MAG: SDR family NAD(P)-dependent oxidoreductase [Nocardioides sp.]